VGFAIDASESESKRQQPNFSLAATQFTLRENQKTQIAHGIRTHSDEKRAAHPSRAYFTAGGAPHAICPHSSAQRRQTGYKPSRVQKPQSAMKSLESLF